MYYLARDIGGFEVVFGGMWMAYAGSPEVTLHLFISEVTTNYERWSNGTYDAFYYKLLREKDEKAGEQISLKMQKIFHTELPSTFVMNNKPSSAYRPTKHGVVLQTPLLCRGTKT